MKKLLTVTALVLAIVAWGKNFRLECEEVVDLNKWVSARNKDASQGKHLFAATKKDNTITTQFDLPEAGPYYLWVRSLSFNENYRRAKIKINGIDCSNFGDAQKGEKGKKMFLWEKAGMLLKLPKGNITIEFIPLSSFARPDVIILSKDKNFTPPDDDTEIQNIKKIHFGRRQKTQANKKKASTNVNVLLFHGGRPWDGRGTANTLKQAGFNVRLVDSTGLAGLGGASIKHFLTDKIEPKAKDEITPEFRKLGNYDVIIINGMKAVDQGKFFTPNRIAKLKKFVTEGGTLITTENVPTSLTELLPVTFTEAENCNIDAQQHYCKPQSKIFKGLPLQWPFLSNRGRTIECKKGVEVLVAEVNDSGTFRMPYIASMAIGQGKSIYWNSDWKVRPNFKQLRQWCYFKPVFLAVVGYGSNINVPEFKGLGRRYKQPEIKKIKSATLKLAPPTFFENEKLPSAKIENAGNLVFIKFANEVVIKFNKTSLTYDVFFPSVELPVYKNVGIPGVVIGSESEQFDQSTYEAVIVGKQKQWYAKLNCKYIDCKKISDNSVEIELTGNEGRKLILSFKAGDLNINGRSYSGFASKLTLEGLNEIVEAIKFTNSVKMGSTVKGHYSWRTACYTYPQRGFAEVNFDEKTNSTTSKWSLFGTGQPFNWLVNQYGILCEFLDSPYNTSVSISHTKNQPFLTFNNTFNIGRQKCPVQIPYMWHYLSKGQPANPNAWQGMYQYLNMRYCKQAGLKQALLYPSAGHVNTCTEEQKIKSMDAAKKLGFRFYKLPWCPSSIESLQGDKAKKIFKQVSERGLFPHPWTAAAYAHGMDDPIVSKHPDWLVYEKNGDVKQYFGHYPVFDINNPEYMQHYKSILDTAIKNGMKRTYLDMAGAQSGVINYKTKTSKPQLFSAIELYKYLNQKGINASIEGMSPLVINEFWFRKNKYVNHTGKEFALVAMAPKANVTDHLVMDYFRLAMNYVSFPIIVSPYACGLETFPNENKLIEEIGKLNPVICKAIDTLGTPLVQQTSFGTSWISDKGAALFFWDPVETLLLTMPENWQIKEIFSLDNKKVRFMDNIVFSIPHKSIILIASE